VLNPGVHVPLKIRASFIKIAVLIGYIAGILHKATQGLCSAPVLVLYAVNALMVIIDSVLYFRNRR
jgi:hypothetical protein